MIPYSLLRIGFYFYHLNVYKQFSQDEIFQSFILGLRFDIAAICLLNIPIVLLSLIPSKNSRFLNFERCLFIFLNFAGIVASLNDYELFLFMGKRLSFDFFVISKDIIEQLPQVFLYYWYLPVTGILFCIGYYFFDRAYFRYKYEKFKLWKNVYSALLILGLTFVGIRGGVQNKSINVQSAFTQGKNELGHLVLNTPYHFVRTLKNKALEPVKYFATREEALNIIINRRDLRNGLAQGEKKNIVLIILESFSNEYMEKDLTPFLNGLKEKSVYFPYHLANGRRSIEALPSLLCGLPSMLDEPISKSIFQGNKFACMPKLLKEYKYTNYFFHGGSKGTMGFESYTLSNGFDMYFSRDNYPRGEDYDGTWGIFDAPYFEYVADVIKQMPEPFLASVFTLSSHHPYAIPKNLENQFPEGSLEIHRSIRYTDYALKSFFEKVEKESWFNNTVFFITSDHTSKLETRKFQNLIGQYRVPLLIYAPGMKLEMNTDRVTQHSDIPKTVLDLVGAQAEQMPATSVSLFSSDKGYALNYADGHDYLLVSKDEVLSLARGQEQKRFVFDWESGSFSESEASTDPLLKAHLQYFLNGLLNNNLSIYR